MGHEVTVTPLQLVYAIGAIANDGVYMRPFVVKSILDSTGEVLQQFEPQVADRIMSTETAHRVTDILVGVTEKGTGGQAKIKGIRVAGKTGTAQKVAGKVYSHNSFYASFIGFAPADDPKLAAVVVFDDPRPFHFGGTVAAPVFREVVGNVLKYLETVQN
jgi:cell division protein FtsI/penicillin-binding protein 2